MDTNVRNELNGIKKNMASASNDARQAVKNGIEDLKQKAADKLSDIASKIR